MLNSALNVTEEYLKKWNLSSPIEIVQTKTSKIYKVLHQNTLTILKMLTPLGKSCEANSVKALQCFNGNGVVKILAFDENALLLEYIDGVKLSTLVDEGKDVDAAHIICDVIDKLHVHDLQPIEIHNLKRHFQSLFLRAKNENNDSIFYKTAKVAEKLISTEKDKKLLHGDIHHTNILKSSSRGWLSIDPQSIFGERIYDVANAFFNPDNRPAFVESRDRIKSLVNIFSERLKTHRRRILEFAYVHGGLSSSWQLDDGENPQRRLRITYLIETLL